MFVGGVLSTRSAWVIGFASFVAWVRAGAEVRTFPSACFYGTTKIMKKLIKVAPKKRRGRPSTGGRDPHITIRMPQALIEEADAWAAASNIVRSEAIRRLVELGLKAKK
jgi:hypothetical protein